MSQSLLPLITLIIAEISVIATLVPGLDPVPPLVRICAMSLQQTLIKARTFVQREQVEAAVNLYRSLLVSFSNHPKINAELGLLMLKHRMLIDFPSQSVIVQSVTQTQ